MRRPVMANTNPNFDAFFERVKDLDIQLSKSDDGVFTACTLVEPLFCHDADSREELACLVSGTLASYARHFYGIEGLDVGTVDAGLKRSPIPVEVSKPVSRLRPVFNEAA
jgi:hypothetical protein